MDAAERGDIYGGYIVGDQRHLVTVPAKSFFGEVYVRRLRGGRGDGGRDLHDETGRPAADRSDRTGALVGLLMLPTLIGGYLIASLMFSATRSRRHGDRSRSCSRSPLRSR